jgi:hypothetical protein
MLSLLSSFSASVGVALQISKRTRGGVFHDGLSYAKK